MHKVLVILRRRPDHISKRMEFNFYCVCCSVDKLAKFGRVYQIKNIKNSWLIIKLSYYFLAFISENPLCCYNNDFHTIYNILREVMKGLKHNCIQNIQIWVCFHLKNVCKTKMNCSLKSHFSSKESRLSIKIF